MSRFDTNKITWPESLEGLRGPLVDGAAFKGTQVVPARAYEELLASAERMARHLEESLSVIVGEFGYPGWMENKAPGTIAQNYAAADAVLNDFHRGENTTDRLFLVITREVAEKFVNGQLAARATMELQAQVKALLG